MPGSTNSRCECASMSNLIDRSAKEQATRSWGMPECLHVPIAAVDESAIRNYVGNIVEDLSGGSRGRAFLVEARNLPNPDLRYPIWRLPGASVFRSPRQVWVDVAYTRYRQAYRKAFPSDEVGDKILSHAMNRRLANILGYQYVRITPLSRNSNSSSAFSENWGVELYRKPAELASHQRRGLFIRYADLTGVMLMLDLKLGGGLMDAVNEGQRLIRLDPSPA